MTLLSLLMLLGSPRAHAFTVPMQGFYGETMAAADFVGTPALGGAVATGLWFGRYDDAYALGKYGSVGTHVSIQHTSQGALLTPQLELRRGWDILLAQVSGCVRAGRELTTGSTEREPHWRASLGGQVKYRYHRYWGVFLNVHGGVIAPTHGVAPVQPSAHASVGIGWSAPRR